MSVHGRKSSGELGDPDLTGADAALRRAGERARREAAAAGQAVVVFIDGEIVWEKPGRSTCRKGEASTVMRREAGRSRLRLRRACHPQPQSGGQQVDHRPATGADRPDVDGLLEGRRRSAPDPTYADWMFQETIANVVAHRCHKGPVLPDHPNVPGYRNASRPRTQGPLYNTLTAKNLYAGYQPGRRPQLLTGFVRYYEVTVTGSSFMEAWATGL